MALDIELLARLRADNDLRPAPGSSHLGAAVLIEPGVGVYRRQDEANSTLPKGGIVLDVINKVDHETGEVDRAFRCIDSYTLAVTVIREADVDIEALTPPCTSDMVRTIRQLAREVHFPRGLRRARTGPFTPDQGQMVKDAYRLTCLVFGG